MMQELTPQEDYKDYLRRRRPGMAIKTFEEYQACRERAARLFEKMRPQIRLDRKLKPLIKKAVETQYLANQRIEKAVGKIIAALGWVDHDERDRSMNYADDVAYLYQTIEDMAEVMAKGEFELDFHAVDCVRNIGRYRP